MSDGDRLIHGGVPDAYWPDFMMEVFRILKPGTGWAQCIETGYPYCCSENDSLPADSALQKVNFPSNRPSSGLMTVV